MAFSTAQVTILSRPEKKDYFLQLNFFNSDGSIVEDTETSLPRKEAEHLKLPQGCCTL